MIKVDATLLFCSEVSFSCRVTSINVEKSDGIFLCSVVGPFTCVCSHFFVGFHSSCVLHIVPSCCIFFFPSCKIFNDS